jgi:hypothetical protein
MAKLKKKVNRIWVKILNTKIIYVILITMILIQFILISIIFIKGDNKKQLQIIESELSSLHNEHEQVMEKINTIQSSLMFLQSQLYRWQSNEVLPKQE